MQKLDRIEKTIFVFTLIYLYSYILEGPLRYVLNVVGLDFIIYVRDIFALIAILASAISIKKQSFKLDAFLFLTLYIVAFFSVIGYYFTGHILQVIFGIKILIPIFLGISFYKYFLKFYFKSKSLIIVTYWIISIGLIFGIAFQFPWAQLSIEVGDQEINVNRNWTYLGFFRPSGFTRSSFSVAGQLLIVSLLLMSFSSIRRKSKFFAWIIAGILIVMTTTKGVILGFLICSLLILSFSFFKNRILKLAPVALLSMMVLVPTFILVLNLKLNLESDVQRFVFLSFQERIERVWPGVINLLQEEGSFILGRGVGGVGTAQSFFESSNYVSPDNLFLYLFSVFGFFGILLIIILLIKLLQKNYSEKGIEYFFYLLGVFIFSYGIISTAIEDPFYGFFFGLYLKYLLVRTDLDAIVTSRFKFVQT